MGISPQHGAELEHGLLIVTSACTQLLLDPRSLCPVIRGVLLSTTRAVTAITARLKRALAEPKLLILRGQAMPGVCGEGQQPAEHASGKIP
jgi:hypothetical protein